MIDGLLAATALHHGLTLVTGNTADMAGQGSQI
jgi:predicted nucleic acid-binding protein